MLDPLRDDPRMQRQQLNLEGPVYPYGPLVVSRGVTDQRLPQLIGENHGDSQQDRDPRAQNGQHPENGPEPPARFQ